ncbi:MAG: phage portal protein [Tannerella sp.]|jgi:hypothetical protein|nr:phage portal protein [Tannerella sp.]
MGIDEILQMKGDDALRYLKKRKTPMPDTQSNLADWDASRHEIMTDRENYPDRQVIVTPEKEVFDEKTGKTLTVPPKTRTEKVNRIAIPLEQDIVNIQTAFTVGTEPEISCDPADDGEKSLLRAISAVFSKNKIKYRNKKIVRSWLSEQEVAEYWYATGDENFWMKFWNRMKRTLHVRVMPKVRLRSIIWSPFRGDALYPLFDDYDDLIAMSREYKRTDMDDRVITCFQTVTKDMVYQWEDTLIPDKTFRHGFSKLPVIYAYRPKPYCEKVKLLRIRIEKLLSSYADCIDYHFFPILKLFGDVGGVMGKTRDKIVQLQGEGADANYLVWQQAPDTVKLELETMFNNAYSFTNTPRISFETMKGFGQAPSGTAFRFVFMGAHMAVENHAEDIGEFLQRRVNFIISALGDIYPYEFGQGAKTIDVETKIIPYMVDNLADRVDIAIKAKNGGVWSHREAIVFAGNVDRIEEEIELIRKEQEEDKTQGEGAE